MSKQIRDDERDEDRRYWTSERRALVAAFGSNGNEDKQPDLQATWQEDLLSIDCLSDDSHHFNDWTATRYTPVFAFVTTWGGPGARWELACKWTGHYYKLVRAAFVFMPWFGWSTHFTRKDSATFSACENMLMSFDFPNDYPALDQYDDED